MCSSTSSEMVAGIPLLVGDFVGSLQTVGSGLIRSEDAEGRAGCS